MTRFGDRGLDRRHLLGAVLVVLLAAATAACTGSTEAPTSALVGSSPSSTAAFATGTAAPPPLATADDVVRPVPVAENRCPLAPDAVGRVPVEPPEGWPTTERATPISELEGLRSLDQRWTTAWSEGRPDRVVDVTGERAWGSPSNCSVAAVVDTGSGALVLACVGSESPPCLLIELSDTGDETTAVWSVPPQTSGLQWRDPYAYVTVPGDPVAEIRLEPSTGEAVRLPERPCANRIYATLTQDIDGVPDYCYESIASMVARAGDGGSRWLRDRSGWVAPDGDLWLWNDSTGQLNRYEVPSGAEVPTGIDQALDPRVDQPTNQRSYPGLDAVLLWRCCIDMTGVVSGTTTGEATGLYERIDLVTGQSTGAWAVHGTYDTRAQFMGSPFEVVAVAGDRVVVRSGDAYLRLDP